MGCLGLLGDLRIVPRYSPTEGERVHPARVVFTADLAVNQPRIDTTGSATPVQLLTEDADSARVRLL